MEQAILQDRSETSKVSTLRAPLWPARSRCQLGSTPQASGVTIPIPVTTTRLMGSTPDPGSVRTAGPAEVEGRALQRQSKTWGCRGQGAIIARQRHAAGRHVAPCAER